MGKVRNSSLLVKIAVMLVLLLAGSGAVAGKTIHVKVGGTGDGSSWANAYGELQAALDDADPNDQIWVAEGKYIPTVLIDPYDQRSATFRMKNNLGIYGGFPAVGDPNWNDRDWGTYETVLSGDLLDNDLEVADPCDLIDDPCRVDNCYHVFYHPEGTGLDRSAVLDGFTVTGGNADGSYPNNSGGGMYNYTGKTSLLITEIGTADPHFIEIQNVNSTSVDTSGWIVLVNDASYSIDAVNSIGWSLPSSVAAGQVLYRTDNPGDNYWGSNIDWDTTGPGWAMIVDETGNISDFMVWGYGIAEIASLSIDFGGFVNISIGSSWNGDGSPVNHSGDYSFKRVGTSDNDSAVDFVLTTPHSKGEENAALITPFSGGPTVSNCTFVGNSARRGGGMYNYQSSLTLTSCVFKGNFADDDGGGVRCDEGDPTVTDCIIESNKASDGGGGIYCNWGSPVINHCTIRDNLAHMGGGMSCGNSTLSMKDCIISCNVSNEVGGAIDCWDSSPTLTNCTINGNTTGGNGGGLFFSGASPTIRNCLITDNTTTGYTSGDISVSLGGGVFCSHPCTAVFTNCTIAGNSAHGGVDFSAGGGIFSYDDSNLIVNNSILWGNSSPEGSQIALSLIIDSNYLGSSTMTVSYSDIQEGAMGVYVESGGTLNWVNGNIDANPCFADEINEDFHLKSKTGRWYANSEIWVQDDITSPCIDAGNPGCLLGDEPNDPNNIRINMGAYGGTAEASKTGANWRSIADLTNDWVIDSNDLKVFVSYWLETGGCVPSDLNRSQNVDFHDYAIFAHNWLQESEICNHVFYIEIETEWDYDIPGSPISYDFEVDVTTDDTVVSIEFITPAGNTYEIPAIAEQCNGEVCTFYEPDGEGRIEWDYYGRFSDPITLANYGNGFYTIIVHYSNKIEQQTTAWYGVPGTSNPIPQPTIQPIMISPEHNSTVASPVDFIWEECVDANATRIQFYAENIDNGDEIIMSFPLSSTGCENVTMSPGEWDTGLSFENLFFIPDNGDGIPVECYKCSTTDYWLTVTGD